MGVAVHDLPWCLQTGRRQPFIDTIHGIELPDFVQKILTFRARLPLCRQSFEPFLFIRDPIAEQMECGRAPFHAAFSFPVRLALGAQLTFSSPMHAVRQCGDELLTAHSGIGSRKQHYKLGQPWREMEQYLTMTACEAATGNV
jgi:hypothetical protein